MEQNTFVGRMVGAATFDIATYEAVEHDTTATTQAGIVVAMSAIAQGIASPYMTVLGGIVGSLIGWFAMAGLTYFIGTRLFSGTATWGELLRTLGFATAPGVLYVLGIIPLLGGLVTLAIALWVLATLVVGIRQALDITTGKAVLTGVLGVVAYGVIMAALRGLW